MNNKHFSLKISIFHGIQAPEEGFLVGYGAIIEAYKLALPIPNTLALISTKNRKYSTGQWQVLTPRHEPKDTLYDQLVFALKSTATGLAPAFKTQHKTVWHLINHTFLLLMIH